MGNLLDKMLIKVSDFDDMIIYMITAADDVSDARYTVNYMEDGGCFQQFQRARHECYPWRIQVRRDRGEAAAGSAEECARATQALLKCMKCRPEHFDAYIRRIEGGLDQDQRPEKVSTEHPAPLEERDLLCRGRRFKWWDGMMRD